MTSPTALRVIAPDAGWGAGAGLDVGIAATWLGEIVGLRLAAGVPCGGIVASGAVVGALGSATPQASRRTLRPAKRARVKVVRDI
jgi:hypothetical protein